MPCRSGDDIVSQDRRFTVGAFGMLTWDQLIDTGSYPAEGTYHIVRSMLEQPGGTTGNTATALARLGVDVSIAARVGADDTGQRLIEDLQVEGCETRHIYRRENQPTDRGVILVSGDDSERDRTILWVQGARLEHGDHLPVEEFFARDLVLVDIDDARLRLLLLDLPMHVSPRTRIFGTMTFLAELRPAQAFELALRHDYLAGHVRELMHATERDTISGAIERFQEEMVLSQVRFAAFTDGANGCLMVTRDEVQEIPAFEIEVRDPTGAGDAFAAGMAWSILKRFDLEQAGRFSNAMGALATRSLGARSSLPDLAAVESFLQSARSRTSRGIGTSTVD
jgi:sugar/nucleoside kinase (ribokinase family)